MDFPSGFSPQSSPSPNRDRRSHSVVSSVVPTVPGDQGLPQDSGSSTLLRIFGPSFHACEEKDLEEFEEAKKKWTECSIDEWKAGAEGEFLNLSMKREMNPHHENRNRFQIQQDD